MVCHGLALSKDDAGIKMFNFVYFFEQMSHICNDV